MRKGSPRPHKLSPHDRNSDHFVPTAREYRITPGVLHPLVAVHSAPDIGSEAAASQSFLFLCGIPSPGRIARLTLSTLSRRSDQQQFLHTETWQSAKVALAVTRAWTFSLRFSVRSGGLGTWLT